ncbi:glycosyltransferase family 4 protein [Chloroflexota bacterium]
MRIVFMSTSVLYHRKRPFGRGGTDSQEYGIAVEMAKRGHDVYIVSQFYGSDWKEYKDTIKKIHFVNISAPYLKDVMIGETASAFMLSHKSVNEIERIKPDVINLTGRFTAYFPSNLNIAKVFITHHPDAMSFYKKFAVENNWLNFFFFPFKRKIEESVMHRSDVIIAIDKDIESYLYGRGFHDICVIPNAIDNDKYTNKGDDNFILYTGRFSKRKAIGFLIEAFSHVSRKNDTTLVLVGTGPEEAKLRKLVASKGITHKVNFLPMLEREQYNEYLSKCSIFVLPSLYETFGVVVVEAMACGKPVIASNIMGPRNIITHGHDGFLFEQGNVDELKQYLELCLSNTRLRKEIGANARQTVEQKFTFNRIAEEYLKLYEQILHSRAEQSACGVIGCKQQI